MIDQDAAARRRHAEQLLNAGRLAEARQAYALLQQAGGLTGDDCYNLGWLLHRLGEPAAALDAYGQALAQGASGPAEIHLNRAVLLAESLGRPAQARAELEQSLRLDPGYLPARLNLGNLLEQLGDREAARSAYEQVLAVQPGHALALARLAGLASGSAEHQSAVSRLQAALQAPHGAPVDRADLGFALARSLDALGRHDDAFAALVQAHADAARLARTRYDPQAHERLVDHVIALFPRPLERLSVPAEEATDGWRPIFICGLFRSGSSLVEQILGSHPEVTCAGEFPALPRLAAPLLGRADAGPPDVAALRALRQGYRRASAEAYPQARVLTDKRLENFLCIGLIKAAFPEARIVHTQRNPLDLGLAIYFQHLDDSMPWARSLEHIGHWHRQYRRLMAHWRSLYGDDILDLTYEQLVEDPGSRIRALLGHCGLPWDEHCLRPHETPSQVRTPSAWQVREPIHRRAAGRSAPYLRHLEALRAGLGA